MRPRVGNPALDSGDHYRRPTVGVVDMDRERASMAHATGARNGPQLAHRCAQPRQYPGPRPGVEREPGRDPDQRSGPEGPGRSLVRGPGGRAGSGPPTGTTVARHAAGAPPARRRSNARTPNDRIGPGAAGRCRERTHRSRDRPAHRQAPEPSAVRVTADRSIAETADRSFEARPVYLTGTLARLRHGGRCRPSEDAGRRTVSCSRHR